MATGGPTRAEGQAGSVVPATNVNPARSARAGHLHMAAQTEIGIRFGKQFGVNRTMGIVASGAAFAQGRMFIHVRLGLLPVALGAGFIQPCHGQPAFRLHDVHAMGIVALDAIHFSLQHRMVIRKMKFSLRVQMTLEAGLRVFAGVNNEFVQAATVSHGNVFAARTVAGLATVLARHAAIFQMQPRMRAGGKYARDFLVAISASRVADISRALNLQRRNGGAVSSGTGT